MSSGVRSTRARLIDMLDAIEGIRAAVAGLDFQQYASKWVTRRAVERGLEIISEASRHLPASIKQANAAVPWQQIAGIGNVLRHEYQRVEDRLVWNVIGEHLDSVEAAIRSALAASTDP